MGRKQLISFALFVLLGACQASVALGDPAFTVSGVVHDGSGGRIPHAHVTVRLAGTQAAAADVQAESGDLGEFSVEVKAAGSYVVAVVADGFGAETVTAEVSAARPVVSLDVAITGERG